MKENRFFDSSSAEILALDEIARLGAQQMLRAALEAEVSAYLCSVQHLDTAEGRQGIVRNGHHRARSITVGSGTIEAVVPRTRNRCGGSDNFVSTIVPPYMRRSPKIDEPG